MAEVIESSGFSCDPTAYRGGPGTEPDERARLCQVSIGGKKRKRKKALRTITRCDTCHVRTVKIKCSISTNREIADLRARRRPE